MAKPKKDDVTVRVEVTVGGVRRFASRPRGTTLFRTNHPRPFPARTPVRQIGGVNYITADGNLTEGDPAASALVVWAKVYPRLLGDEDVPDRPDVGALSCKPLADGTWHFDLPNLAAGGQPAPAHGSQLPGAVCASVELAGNNNTLLVWYEFAGVTDYEIEQTPFYAPCPAVGSGSGSGVEPGNVPRCSVAVPTTLFATFTGALSALGSVELNWNGATWAGAFGGCGGVALIFNYDNPGFSLFSTGPGTTFALPSAPADSCCPFSWVSAGAALGACAGAFGVIVME